MTLEGQPRARSCPAQLWYCRRGRHTSHHVRGRSGELGPRDGPTAAPLEGLNSLGCLSPGTSTASSREKVLSPRRRWGQHCDPGSRRVWGGPPDTHGRRHSVAGMGPCVASAGPLRGTVQSATQASLELSAQDVAWSPCRAPSLQGHTRDRKWPGHHVGVLSPEGHTRACCGGSPAPFLFQLHLLSVEGDGTAEVTFPGVTRAVRSSPGLQALTLR